MKYLLLLSLFLVACSGAKLEGKKNTAVNNATIEKFKEAVALMQASNELSQLHTRFAAEGVPAGSQAFRDLISILRPQCTLEVLEDKVQYPEGKIDLILRRHIAGTRCAVSAYALTRAKETDVLTTEKSFTIVPVAGAVRVPYTLGRLALVAKKEEFKIPVEEGVLVRSIVDGTLDAAGKENLAFRYLSVIIVNAAGDRLREEISLKMLPSQGVASEFKCSVNLVASGYSCTVNGEAAELKELPALRPIEI